MAVHARGQKKANVGLEEKRLAAGGEKPEESELQVSEGEAVRVDPGFLHGFRMTRREARKTSADKRKGTGYLQWPVAC